jgi:hypothetical protein
MSRGLHRIDGSTSAAADGIRKAVRQRIDDGSKRGEPERDTDTMKKVLATFMSVAFLAMVGISEAQTTASCPPEVAKAKQMLQQKGSASVRTDVQTPQAPRSLAGARGQDVQAPRGQDVQAPRSPVAGAKGGSTGDASKLIREAEAACKAGDMKTAKSKAEAAIGAMK